MRPSCRDQYHSVKKNPPDHMTTIHIRAIPNTQPFRHQRGKVPPSRLVKRTRSRRSNGIGFAVIVALGLALASAGFTQTNRDGPLTSAQDHVRLPSLAPVVQAV